MESKGKNRFMISGGGTGGHVFPAIAIGKGLQKMIPDAEIEFVGAVGKMEMSKVPEAGFKIHGLRISGIDRKISLSNFFFPFKLASSIWNARRILTKFKPEVVIGVGGYASGPLLYASTRMGIPSLILEPNGYPGITNKLLAKHVDKICVSLPGMERFFPERKLVITGNPIRQDILEGMPMADAKKHFELDPDKPCILIIGGSLGARTINQSIAAGLDKFRSAGVQIIWQTGKNYSEQHDVPGVQLQFINDMKAAYASADLVISRAGASSLSELCALGKPSILVPSPNVAEDHQTKNAKALVEADAAVLIPDKEAGEKLVDQAIKMISDAKTLDMMSVKALTLGLPQATESIVEEIKKLMR